MAKEDEGYLLDGSGKRVLSGSGEAVRTGSYDDEKVTQNRMKAAENKLAEDVQKKLKEDKAKDDADFDAEEARSKTARAVAGAATKAAPAEAAPTTKATPTKKAPIVTKEQLAKSGFTNLRDFLNDQKKLKRRDGTAPDRKASAPAVSSSYRSEGAGKAKPAAASKSTSGNYSNEGRSTAKKSADNYSNEGRGRPAPVEKKKELGPLAAGRYSPGYAKQLEQTEQKRIGRLEAERIRDAEKNAKRESEFGKFNEAMKSDPKQKELKADREKNERMTPGQRSAARGKSIKEFFGLAKGGSVRGSGIAQRGVRKCKIV